MVKNHKKIYLVKIFRLDFLIFFFKGSSGGKRGRLLTMFAPEQIRMLGPTNEPLYLVVCISMKKRKIIRVFFIWKIFLVLDTFLPFYFIHFLEILELLRIFRYTVNIAQKINFLHTLKNIILEKNSGFFL